MKRLLSLILLFGSLSYLSNAQSLSVGTKQASLGDTVCLDLKTEDISNMLTAQFTIDYFDAHLEFIGVDNFNLSQDPPTNSFSNHISGYVTFSWSSDDLVNGYDLEEDEVIFEVCFKVITDNITTPVYLTGSPTSVEITNKDLEVQQVSLGLGLVVVGNGTMVDDPIVNIPDIQFKNDIIAKGFDLNNDGAIQESEAKDIFSLHSNELGIESAEGIQYFSNLTNLKLINNSLTELDVSNNLNLNSLECQGNSISELELAPELEFLNCSQNNLTELSLGMSPTLNIVSCHSNLLEYLEVSNLWQLEALDCGNNNLDGLLLGNNEQLEYLICSGNNIEELDLTNNFDLEYLDCSMNLIDTLDLEDHEKLDNVYCQDNLIDELILLSADELEKLDCSRNQINSLVFGNHSKLNSLKCGGNELTSIDLSTMSALFTLECQENELDAVDLSANSSLSVLDCSGNDLTDLDMQSNESISFLNCSDNLLTSIDVSFLDNLLDYDCSKNLLEQLDVLGLSELSMFDCSYNLLTTLDLSTNSNLQVLNCASNELSNLNLRNGALHGELDFSDNNEMTSVCVDDAEQEQVLGLVDGYGYMNCQVLLDCSMVANEELDQTLVLSVYPTIVDNRLNIEYEGYIEQIILTDTKGSIMYSNEGQFSTGFISLDVSEKPAGIYFLAMQLNGRTYQRKIIKN